MPNLNEMTDLHIGPTSITRPKIRCYSVVKTIKCHYAWTIMDYKSALVTVKEDRSNNYGTSKLLSQPFSATKDTSKWNFELRSCYRSTSRPNMLNLYLQRETLYLENLNDLKVVEIKCAIINSENQETSYCIEKMHLLHSGKDYEIGDIISVDELLKNENALLPQNKLTLDFEITFHKQDMMGDYQESSNITSESIDSNLEYFGKLFNNSEFSDVTIHVNGKEYPAHKSILVGRSPVFAAMLKHDMKENQTNRIEIKDIEEEIFLEALRFIYTGKVQNLETLAFELLPVADKYDLEKLKIMCGNELSKKLSVGTAVKILVLADTYHLENLKKKAINFIRAYSVDVVSKVDSEAWNGLMSQPGLAKDVFLACLK